jgi:hypothetical protein
VHKSACRPFVPAFAFMWCRRSTSRDLLITLSPPLVFRSSPARDAMLRYNGTTHPADRLLFRLDYKYGAVEVCAGLHHLHHPSGCSRVHCDCGKAECLMLCKNVATDSCISLSLYLTPDYHRPKHVKRCLFVLTSLPPIGLHLLTGVSHSKNRKLSTSLRCPSCSHTLKL